MYRTEPRPGGRITVDLVSAKLAQLVISRSGKHVNTPTQATYHPFLSYLKDIHYELLRAGLSSALELFLYSWAAKSRTTQKLAYHGPTLSA